VQEAGVRRQSRANGDRLSLTLRASGAERARIDGRRLDPGKSCPLTRSRRKRVWCPANAVGAPASAAGDGCDKDVRGQVTDSTEGRQHPRRERCRRGCRIAAPARTERRSPDEPEETSVSLGRPGDGDERRS
jgi:hypothetical protein